MGPLAGIEAALGATACEANLVVACDMPALDVGTLETLFAAEADCTVPQYLDGKLEPLCAVYSRRCHAAIRGALDAGVRKVTDALALLETQGFAIRYVRVASGEEFANLNTPADLARYRERRNG
jgi:molybdopterin-guanine dinucleotide biosynthesis protein A